MVSSSYLAASRVISEKGFSSGSPLSSITSQRRNVSKLPVLRSISTRTSISPSYLFLVAVASAISIASKIFSRGSAFSLETASTTNRISLFIPGRLVSQILEQYLLFEYLRVQRFRLCHQLLQ